MLNGAKPVTSNNISTITATAAKATTTKPAVKIATSNLFIDTLNVPDYKSIEDLIFETLNSGEILDYGNTQATVVGSVGTGINGFQDDNLNLIDTRLYPDSNIDEEIPYDGNGPNTTDGSTGGSTGGIVPIDSNINYYYPIVGNGIGGEYVYFNTNNNLVIDLINVREGQYVEIEFWKYETELNDTIYS